MKKILLFFCLIFTSNLVIAQNWTWLTGSNNNFENGEVPSNQIGVYGTLGVSSSTTTPGARFGGNSFTHNGELYTFGGYGLDGAGNQGYLNDLWKYNTTTNQWTWVSGSQTANPVASFGTQNVAAPTNIPSGRYQAATWYDNGKFYVLGGDKGYVNGNDLWEYDLTTGLWTWKKGATTTGQNGVYGTKGTAAPGNTPGARNDATTWTQNGKLYLFGGTGKDATGLNQRLNDLWEYDPATNNWKWLTGSNVTLRTNVLGGSGVFGATYTPASRTGGAGWVSGGKFYLFGGYATTANGASGAVSDSDDVWVYDPAINQWAWLKGSLSTTGITKGASGVTASAYTPGSRMNSGVTWEVGGKLYMFSGQPSSASSGFNDIWGFDTGTNQWGWTSGSAVIDQYGNYGTQGVAAPTNKPGTRYDGVGWAVNGTLYTFGGNGMDGTGMGNQGLLNDLWKSTYAPLPVRLLAFDARLMEDNRVALTWETADEVNNGGFYLQKSGDAIHFENIGFVPASGKSASKYSFEDAEINQTTYYRLKQVDTDGTTNYTRVVSVSPENTSFKMYPSPVVDVLHLSGNVENVRLMDASGSVLKESQAKEISFNGLPAGMYLIEVRAGGRTQTRKIVKQ